MAMGVDDQSDHDPRSERPERPPTRVREPSPIDDQRQPAVLTRTLAMWRAACLTGLLALVTAALWRDGRRDELLEAVGSDVAAADAEQAVTLLVISTFAILTLLLLLAALLSARLTHGGTATRLTLTFVALLQTVAVGFAIEVLTAWQWEGFVTSGLFVLQVLLGAVGAVLMWLPGSRRH